MNNMYSLVPEQPAQQGLQVPAGPAQGVKAPLPPEEMEKMYSFAAQEFPSAQPEEIKTMVDQYVPMLPGDTADDKIGAFVKGMQEYGSKVTDELFSKYSAFQQAGEEQFNKWRDENQVGKMASSVIAGLRAGYGSPEALQQNNAQWAQQEQAARDRTVGAAERKIELHGKAQSAAKMQMDITSQALNMGIAKEQADQAGKKFKLEYESLTNQAEQNKRLRDPNSIESQTMRNLAAQVGAKVTGQETAETLQKIIPVQAEVFKAMVDAQAKQAAQNVALQQLQLDRQYKMGQLGIQSQEAATRQAREEREAHERSPEYQAAVTGSRAQAEEDVKKKATRASELKNIENALIPSLDNAIRAVGKSDGLTTGPIAGRLPTFRQASQEVEQALSKVQLEGVQAFIAAGGGASMLNSNAEREAFNSAGPNVRNDASVNMKILLGQKAIALRNKAIASGKSLDDATLGSMVIVDPKEPTKMKLVGNNPIVLNDAEHKGYVPLDTYLKGLGVK